MNGQLCKYRTCRITLARFHADFLKIVQRPLKRGLPSLELQLHFEHWLLYIVSTLLVLLPFLLHNGPASSKGPYCFSGYFTQSIIFYIFDTRHSPLTKEGLLRSGPPPVISVREATEKKVCCIAAILHSITGIF